MKRCLLLFLLLAGYSRSGAQDGPALPPREGDDSAVSYIGQNNDSVVLRNLAAALNVYAAANDRQGMINCYTHMGQILINHTDFSVAMIDFLHALKLCEQAGDKIQQANCYNSIGIINKKEHLYTEALKNHMLALAIFEKQNDKTAMGNTYNAIGDVYENQGDYAKALQSYSTSIRLINENGAKKELVWPYYNIGEVYMLQGRYTDALANFYSALEIEKAYKETGAISWTYNDIGAVYIKEGKYADAEKYCTYSLNISAPGHDIAGVKNANINLSKIYEAQGAYQQALNHYKVYTALQDSMFNDENIHRLTRLQMQYEFDKKEEIGKERQNRKDIVTAGIVIAFALIVVIGLGAYRNQKRANDLKDQLLKQKETSLRQKELLVKEIHHRVKNNLQMTGTLLDLQLERIADQSAKNAITDSISRLKAIALTHLQLNQNDEMASIEFSQFATQMHCQSSAIFSDAGQKVTLNNSMPHTFLDMDTAVPAGLILNELMTNSYKHGFKGANGSIDIGIVKNTAGYTLTYKDSGPGLPLDFDIKTSKNLGMTIIQSLSKQIGGTFGYLSDTHTFVVTFRDAADMKKDA